jgi:hypothetical protein
MRNSRLSNNKFVVFIYPLITGCKKFFQNFRGKNILDEETTHKTEKQYLKEQLTRLLSAESDGLVISLQGSWGIGKTYFWQAFSKDFTAKTQIKCAYVSLFGKTSLEEIKQDIIIQISSKDKWLADIKDRFGELGYQGISLASCLSILEKKDFQDIIVCFDDFERLSRLIDLKDVIGLVSELKEQKKCKIVIINNVDHLEDADLLNSKRIIKYINKNEQGKDINKTEKKKETKYYISNTNNEYAFKLFNEKIIDCRLVYNPSIEENYLLFKDKIKYFDHELIINFLKWTNVDQNNLNIRTLKQLYKTLNIFSFLIEHKIRKELRDSIAAYIFEKIYNTKIDPAFFIPENIDPAYEFIDSALNRSFLYEQEKFLDVIDQLSKELKNKEINIELRKVYDKFLYDLNYDNSDFIREFNQLLFNQSDNIIKIIGWSTYSYFVKLLIEFDPDNKDRYELSLKKFAKKFIDNLFANQDYIPQMELEDIFQDYNEIVEYIKQKREDKVKEIVSDPQSIIKKIYKVIDKSAWSRKDERILASVTVSQHKEFMKKSMDYVRSVFEFALWIKSNTLDRSFSDAYNNILAAFNEISSESVGYKVKLSKIITELNKQQTK